MGLRRAVHRTLRLWWLVLPLLLLAVPITRAEASPEEAQRQLQLAEDDLDAGNYERAAASAASALRFDPALQEALVVRALALKGLGRLDDAAGLLRAYRDLRGTLPLDERVAPALAELERLLAAAREPEPAESTSPAPASSGPVALLYGPERPGAAEDAWAAAEPFLGGAPPIAVIPIRAALPAGGNGLITFGASSTRCPASLPDGELDELLQRAEQANVELETEAADAAIAAAELHLVCGSSPADPDTVARLLAASAAARWVAGEPEVATRLWREVFLVAVDHPVDSTLAPTATALQLTAKTRARDEAMRGQLYLALPTGWSAWVDGVAVANPPVELPRGRRLVRVLGPDGEGYGAVITVAEGPVLVTTAEGLREAVEGPETPDAVLRAVAPSLEEAARREGADGAVVVNLAAEPVAVRRFQGGRWLTLTTKATRRDRPGRTSARTHTDRAGPHPGSVALLGGGLAATAVGVIVAALAHRDGAALSGEMGTPRGFGDNYLGYEASRTREGIGTGIAIGGGVAAGVGVLTFAIPNRVSRPKVDGEANP
jgi:tetratricopeptide (TPR) repeat protein